MVPIREPNSNIAAFNGWSEAEQGQFLAVSLSGSAVGVLASLDAKQRSCYAAIDNLLNSRFNENTSTELSSVKLQTRCRARSGSQAVFANNIGALVTASYPSLSCEALEILGQEYFYKLVG